MFTKKPSYKNLTWLIIAVLIILIDQYSKILIMRHLPLEQALSITPFFSLYFTFNPGAAFSFLAGAIGWQKWFFVMLSAGVSIYLVIWLWRASKETPWLQKLAFMLVLGGAIGNLIDRLYYGMVRDFLDFYWHTWHWPVFNLADTAITCGVILLLLASFAKEQKTIISPRKF